MSLVEGGRRLPPQPAFRGFFMRNAADDEREVRMVFEKSLRRELFSSAGGVFVTLLTIVITNSLIRILGQAAAGKVGVESVVLLIGFAALNILPMVIVLTLFIAVLLVVSRMYRDSEMVVWFSSGVALTDLVRPVLRFAAPFALTAFVLGMFITPWANQQSVELRARFDQRDDVSRVSAGQFIESSDGQRVFFVENLDDVHGTVDNVFAVMRDDDNRTAVLAARSGKVETRDNGERYIALDAGRRYEGMPGSARYSVMEFDRYLVRLTPKEINIAPPGTESRTMTANQIVGDATPSARSELIWRISLPLYSIVLALLAIPLAYLNPRAGRSANLIFAILVFVIYQSLVQLARSYVGSGRMSFGIGWWIVHAAFGLFVVAMFWQRRSAATLSPWSWRTWQVWLTCKPKAARAEDA